MIYRLFKYKPQVFSVETYSAGNLLVWSISLFVSRQFSHSSIYRPMENLADEKMWAVFFALVAVSGVYLFKNSSVKSNLVFSTAYLCLTILFLIGNPSSLGGYIYLFYAVFHFAKWRVESFYHPQTR